MFPVRQILGEMPRQRDRSGTAAALPYPRPRRGNIHQRRHLRSLNEQHALRILGGHGVQDFLRQLWRRRTIKHQRMVDSFHMDYGNGAPHDLNRFRPHGDRHLRISLAVRRIDLDLDRFRCAADGDVQRALSVSSLPLYPVSERSRRISAELPAHHIQTWKRCIRRMRADKADLLKSFRTARHHPRGNSGAFLRFDLGQRQRRQITGRVSGNVADSHGKDLLSSL